MRILGAFSALAITLAIAALYGLIACNTAKRTKEFGIRMALGALPSRISRLVLRQGGALTGAGVVVGLAVAAGATRLSKCIVWRIASGWGVFLAAGAIFIAIGLFVCFVPARRATWVDPMVALRDE